MSRVAVRPELIRWARERAGLKADALAEHFPNFAAWETGDLQPTLRQLEDLAKRTLTPLGYFFLAEPPEDTLPIQDFRTVKDATPRRPSPNLLETVQIMQRRQAWMREFLIEQGQDPLPFVGSATLSTDPLRVALKIRAFLGLQTEWASLRPSWTDALRALRAAVEEAGILVAINGVVGNNIHRKLDPGEFRGFILTDEFAPLVFINGADAKAAQMFTLAHELGHLWLGRGGVFNLEALQPAENDVEKFCNRVAAEFLIPSAELKACWPEVVRLDQRFQTLASRFKISPLVAARRALDLGLIQKTDFFEFYEAYQADDRRKAGQRKPGGDFYATQEVRLGRRFGEAVIRSAREGRLLYRDAYQLTGLFGRTFDQFAKGLGFGGE